MVETYWCMECCATGLGLDWIAQHQETTGHLSYTTTPPNDVWQCPGPPPPPEVPIAFILVPIFLGVALFFTL